MQSENTQFDLDISILEQPQESTSSLEEVYGHEVFSEEFSKNIRKYKEEQQKEHKQYLKDVLAQQKQDPVEMAFHTVMEADQSVIIRRDYNTQDNTKDRPLMIAGFVLLGAILTLVVLVWIEKKQKEKHKNEIDSDNRNFDIE